MGLDYIRSQTGKPWSRRWDGGLDRLKTPTLLDLTITETLRFLTAELSPNVQVKTGNSYIVECEGKNLTISEGLRLIGHVARPPEETLTAIANCGGYAEGVIQRVGLFGDTAEIQLR
ncbi:hypothetical protein ACFCQI_14345 [Rhodanobacter sp. FW102-FHT14D06]|jgi:hypothetical protein|uniref:Uncharacterized protein n=2 Tax=unclassified Rhodanobacter TaxID=2621553 RepID=A0AB74V0D0_9GAMM|nr:hypothetical protein [Rhodanobacter sp.]